MSRPREFDEQAALDSAVEAFWSHTYAGTSTAVLCDATGLSRSSLYNTFTGKPELYQRTPNGCRSQFTSSPSESSA